MSTSAGNGSAQPDQVVENPATAAGSGSSLNSANAVNGTNAAPTADLGNITLREMLAFLQQQNESVMRTVTAALQSRASVPPSDLERGVSDYNGMTSGLEASEWLSALEATSKIHKWSDAVKLEAARRHMVAAAKDWFVAHHDEFETWPDFVSAFKSMFATEVGVTEKWRRLNACVQRREESVLAYAHLKIRLCRELHLSMTETRRQVAIGLWSREMASHLMSRMQYDEQAIIQDLQEYEIVEKERRSRFRAVSSYSSENARPNQRSGDFNDRRTTSTVSKTAPTTSTNNSGTNFKPEFGNRDPRCFNCNRYGHISRDCPLPSRRARPVESAKFSPVGSDAATKKFEPRSTGIPEKKVLQVLSGGSTSAKYLKRAKIDGRLEVTAFIDPGSAVCIVSATTAVQLASEITPCTETLYGFGASDKGTQAIGKFFATIEIDGVSVEMVPVLIVPDAASPHSVLIGRPWIDHPTICYARVGEKLLLGYARDNPFGCMRVANGDTSVEISVDEDTILPPNRVNIVYDSATPKISRDNLVIGESLSDGTVEALVKLVNKYRSCFALQPNEFGYTNLIEMRIEEVPGSRPVASRPYRLSPGERQELARVIREWRDAGIVIDTTSPYASPALLVSKSTGEGRPVIDYRKLNSQTIKEHYPLPPLEDHLGDLAGAELFATLDLASGYLQIPLAPESQEKTAFITPDETGQFTRMIFGLTNAPAVFQRLMNKVLGELRGRVAFCYLDDIMVPAVDEKDLLLRLEAVLVALHDAKLMCRLSKCVFGRKEVEFLGFVVGNGQLRPGPRKLLCIEEYPSPQNEHEVRRFLGLTGFFRRFVPNYAQTAAPLSLLLQKNQPFIWSVEQKTAFETLKNALVSKPVLQLFNPRAYTELHTDASADGLAALLLQRGDDGKLHLVHCVSKKTTLVERFYHSSKLELLAVVWALEKLRVYVLPLHVVVVTDCQALLYLNSQRTKNAQIARWAILLQEYDLEFRHRKGEQMAHVDALSRAPVLEDEVGITERLEVFAVVSVEQRMQMFQSADPELKQLIERLRADDETLTTDYSMKNGVLLRKFANRRLFVVPKSMRKSLAVKYHDLSGHFSLERTLDAITQLYWFPGMRRYLKMHIQMCPECVLFKGESGKPRGQLNPVPPGKRPFEVVHLDHLGPFPTSLKKNRELLVVVDKLTRFVRLYATKSTDAKGVIISLREFGKEFGLPDRYVTDRGTCFTSAEMEKYCQEAGIALSVVATKHPRANGLVERVNRVLVPCIAATVQREDYKDWDSYLDTVMQWLNTARNKSTGRSPFEVLHGFTPRYADPIAPAIRELLDNCTWTPPEQLQEEAQEATCQAQAASKKYFDRSHCAADKYAVGELVVMRRTEVPENKLAPKYKGPLIITSIKPGDIYGVSSLDLDASRIYASTVHVSRLRPWRPQDLDGEEDADISSEMGESEEEQRPRRTIKKPNRFVETM